jgi:hypothetical protein
VDGLVVIDTTNFDEAAAILHQRVIADNGEAEKKERATDDTRVKPG